MPSGSGSPFRPDEEREIAEVITRAHLATGVHYSVFVGSPNGPARPYAQRLHAALGERAPYGVLVLVAPAERQVEIVTGRRAARVVDDHECELAAAAMVSAFAGGDLARGIIDGIRILAQNPAHIRGIAV